MKKIALMTVAVAAISTPALAQNSAALCKIYMQQGGSAAVSANYQPGVDVNGRPVVPADGGAATAIGAPGSVRIPVTVDLAQRLGIPVPGGVALDAPVGVANISGNGAVSFNGHDITAQTATLCTQPYVPAVSPAREDAPSTALKKNDGFDYDAAWSPARAAAAGVLTSADAGAPAPMGLAAPSRPLSQGAVVPAAEPAVMTQPSLASEPAAYVPPAVVPAVTDDVSAAPAPQEAAVESTSAIPAGSAVHTPEPAAPVVGNEQAGSVHQQSGVVTEQDGIIYGEGR